MYDNARALNAAAHNEIDDVIDPADTRRRVTQVLAAAPSTKRRNRPMIDSW